MKHKDNDYYDYSRILKLKEMVWADEEAQKNWKEFSMKCNKQDKVETFINFLINRALDEVLDLKKMLFYLVEEGKVTMGKLLPAQHQSTQVMATIVGVQKEIEKKEAHTQAIIEERKQAMFQEFVLGKGLRGLIK